MKECPYCKKKMELMRLDVNIKERYGHIMILEFDYTLKCPGCGSAYDSKLYKAVEVEELKHLS